MNNITRKEAQKRFYLTFRNLSIQRLEMIKMKKSIIAAILLTVIAVTGLNFAGAFASTGSSVSFTHAKNLSNSIGTSSSHNSDSKQLD